MAARHAADRRRSPIRDRRCDRRRRPRRGCRSAEAGQHNEATEAGDHNERTEESETGEKILDVNLESTPLVVLAVIISVAMAAATSRTDNKFDLFVTALFAAAFAFLDVAEFSHQIKESAATIAALAAIIAVLHGAAALLAEQRRAAIP